MARSYEITVRDRTFIGMTASAVAQDEMLGLVGQAGILPLLNSDESISDMSKVTFMMTVPKNIRDRLAQLATRDLIKTDEGMPVAINLFADNIQDWQLLIIEALRENLGSFFTLSAHGNPAEDSLEEATA